jgi:rhodanese-related sulfurtransferase
MSIAPSISAASLKQLMNDEPSLVIIDVLPADPFREVHLPTAENFCVYESAFVSKVLGAHANPSQPIVVYGERSGTLEAEIAAEKLQAARGSDSFFLGRRFHRTNCGKSGRRSSQFNFQRVDSLATQTV